MIKNCETCKKEFKPRLSSLLYSKKLYCCVQCYHESMLGKQPSNIKELTIPENLKKAVKLAVLKTKGSKIPLERRKRISDTMKSKKNHLWKGGITKTNILIRNGLEYRLWRESVFKRDNHTCVECGERSRVGKRVVLNADHIKPFAIHIDSRFDINNGRTLCVSCHKKTSTYLNRWINNTITI